MFYICRRLISVHMRVFLFFFYILLPFIQLGSPCPFYDNNFHEAVILFFGIFYIKYFKQIALSINNCKMLAL